MKKSTALFISLLLATGMFFGVSASVSANENMSKGQMVVDAGSKYLGTPYQYGSSRSTKTTMDCSEFVMWAYRDGIGLDMGKGGSTSQSKYVKSKGVYSTDIDDLQIGDLVFFMSYKGYKESDYKGIDRSKQSITHVALYMGNNKILHTYSKQSGGVKITSFKGTSWALRFVGGGRPYKDDGVVTPVPVDPTPIPSPDPAPTPEVNDKSATVKSYVWFHRGSSSNKENMINLKPFTVLKVYEVGKYWTKVEYKGVIGYVSTRYLSIE